MQDQFRTTFELGKVDTQINYKTSSLWIGSCFIEHIGDLMVNYKFKADVNPFGVCYNPMSIKNNLEILINQPVFDSNDLFFYNEQWNSFNHHSQFSDSNQEVCLNNINQRIKASGQFLKEADFLFVTFGTAWVFEYLATGQIVSNCHKLPQSKFKRYLLSPNEIVNNWKSLIAYLTNFNNHLHIVFTVSPIRHFKDGAEANMLSKATLLVAVHELKKIFPDVCYFPAYEMMMDDLRDYRFYEEDMIHPNHTAIQYIWESFTRNYMDEETLKIMEEIDSILKAAHHRPFDPASKAHQKFLANNIQKIDRLKNQYPCLNLETERYYFSNQLK